MNYENGVPFDPGFAGHTYSFSQNVKSVDDIMASIKALHQKRFQYKVFLPKVLKLLHNSVSFYLGCLLWASYIVNKFKNDPKKILDNPYVGKHSTDEELFFEINYMLDYFEKIKKDSHYYLGKTQQLSQDWQEVLETYKDFLSLNGNLSGAFTTADVKLPSRIKPLDDEALSSIAEKIEEVTASGNLEELFAVKETIL